MVTGHAWIDLIMRWITVPRDLHQFLPDYGTCTTLSMDVVSSTLASVESCAPYTGYGIISHLMS